MPVARAKALLAKGTKRIYYKYSALFASTGKGNIGPVSEALMSLTGVDHVLFCPAWRGTTVYLGRLFVNNVMLHESGASRDPCHTDDQFQSGGSTAGTESG